MRAKIIYVQRDIESLRTEEKEEEEEEEETLAAICQRSSPDEP